MLRYIKANTCDLEVLFVSDYLALAEIINKSLISILILS